jgi:LmbE family N-acetylglucosaminyl deacetylase
VSELITEVPSRALAVYAHPNDSDVACAGTLARWAAAGCEVALVVCATGDKGTKDAAVDPGHLAEQRAGEVATAATRLGIAAHEILGWPDGEVENDRHLRSQIVGWIRRWRPEVVLGPDPSAVFFGTTYVNHRDHRQVGWAVLDAVAPAAASPHYFPETGPAHQIGALLLSGTLHPDVVVDIGDHLDRKADALRCHASQLGGDGSFVDRFVRGRASEAGGPAGVEYGEAFRRLTFT